MLQIIANNLINEYSLIMPGLGTYYKAFSLTTTKLAIEQPIVFKYNNSPNLFNYKFIGLLKNIYYSNIKIYDNFELNEKNKYTELAVFNKKKFSFPNTSKNDFDSSQKLFFISRGSYLFEIVPKNKLILRSYTEDKNLINNAKKIEISPFKYRSLNSFFYKKINNLSSNNSSEEEELLPISSSSSSSSSSVSKTEEKLLNISSSSSSSLLAPINNNKKIIDFKIEIQDNNTYIITEFKESEIPIKLNIKVENIHDLLKGYKGKRSPNLLIRFLQESLIYGEFYIQNLIEKEMSKTIENLNISKIPYNKPRLLLRIKNSDAITNKKIEIPNFCNNILDLYNHKNKNHLKFFMYTNLLNVNDDNTLGLSDNINKSIILKIKSFVENRQNEEYSKDATKYLNFIANNNFEEANNLFHIKYENNYKNFHKMILRKIFLKQYEAHITKNNIVC